MHKIIVSNSEKCVGCGICELICTVFKDKNFNPTSSRIRIVRIQPVVDIALACRLCEKPPCVAACPRNALVKSEETGIIMVNEDKCSGCKLCIEVCEFGAISLNPNKKVVSICDLCEGDPKCVKYCPTKALELTNLDRISGRHRVQRVKELTAAHMS